MLWGFENGTILRGVAHTSPKRKDVVDTRKFVQVLCTLLHIFHYSEKNFSSNWLQFSFPSIFFSKDYHTKYTEPRQYQKYVRKQHVPFFKTSSYLKNLQLPRCIMFLNIYLYIYIYMCVGVGVCRCVSECSLFDVEELNPRSWLMWKISNLDSTLQMFQKMCELVSDSEVYPNTFLNDILNKIRTVFFTVVLISIVGYAGNILLG